MENTSKKTRWFTALPMAFKADGRFFDRDSGLVCVGLRSLGIDSRLVLLHGEPAPADLPLLTTTRGSMGDPGFWRSCGAEGIVLNSWGGPRFEDIARAVNKAGLRLVVRLDSNGIKSPVAYFPQFVSREYSWYRDLGHPLPGASALAKAVLFRYFPRLHDDAFLRHVGHADAIGVESPLARICLTRVLIARGRSDLARRLIVMPHPVLGTMTYDPTRPKKKQILAAGRWDAFIKDTPMLMRVLRQVLERRTDHTAVVAGSGGDRVLRHAARWPAALRERLSYVGDLHPREMPALYQDARITLVTSRWESFCMTAAEAVCCGCSVAAPARIASMNYFVEHQSGSLAAHHATDELADAVFNEVEAWDQGRRDPCDISMYWTKILHPGSVAAQVMNI
jgi:glycosyltransferase involved in cell wall biosynthesis